MEKRGSWAVLLAAVILSYEYVGYSLPDGAPEQACSTLIPDHPTHEPRECDINDCSSLFVLRMLEIDSEPVKPEIVTYRCGASHTVSLEATINTFRGFFVQSRASTPEFDPTAPFIGEFRPSSTAQTCSNGGLMAAGVTHSDTTDKDNATFTWIAPPANQAQPVTFWYSVFVQNEVFYIHLNKALIPDEGFCILGEPQTQEGFDAMFSLPEEPIIVVEGNPTLTVCVTKTGQTERTLGVNIFTSELDQGAQSDQDFEDLFVNLQFLPEDNFMCVDIAILDDGITERPEAFEVVIDSIDFNVQLSPSRVIVEINDESFVECTPSQFECSQEAFCLPQSYVCDGIEDCLLPDDEIQCDTNTCEQGTFRLSGGRSPGEGLVEVCIGDSFSTICLNEVQPPDSVVVCESLGFDGAGVWVNALREFGAIGNGPIVGDFQNCTNLLDCSATGNDNCGHVNDAGIRCLVDGPVCEHGSTRLEGDDSEEEGVVQVCFRGLWGSIISQSWGFSESRVACRSLGRDEYGALPIPQYSYSNGDDVIIAQNVQCSGSEQSLLDCDIDYSRFEENSDGGFLVGVRCDDLPATGCTNGEVRLVAREAETSGLVEVCLGRTWTSVCFDTWGVNEARVTCRQLNRTVVDSGSVTNGLGNPSSPILEDPLDCSGNESNLLDCLRPLARRRKRQVSICITAGVRCAESPQILLSPPSEDGSYVIEVGREVEIRCLLEPNLYYPGSLNITTYRVVDNEMTMIDSSNNEGDEVDLVREDVGAELEATGTYVCMATNAVDSARQTVQVRVIAPSGPRSRVHIRFSLPQLDRLTNVLPLDIVMDILNSVEFFVILRAIDLTAPGQQGAQCNPANRTFADLARGRDRYECTLDNYPPSDDPIAMAQTVVQYMEGTFISFAAINISETGFCEYDVDETAFGTYMWPETIGGNTATLPCALNDAIQVTRDCLNGSGWDVAQYAACELVITEDNLDEVNEAVVEVVQDAQQTEENAQRVRDVIFMTAVFALNDPSLIDEAIVSSVIDTLDGLQDWPAEVIQENDAGAEIVQSFENIAISLAQQENFTELTVTNENITVRIENVDLNNITTGRSIAASDGNGSLNTTFGDDDELADDQIASGFLPPSLFDVVALNEDYTEDVPIVLAILRTGSLFSIENNQQGTAAGFNTTVGSPVVSLIVGVNQTFTDLPDPVIVNVRILVQNFTNPRCASYDFDQQAWVTDGCTTDPVIQSNQITCRCDHLTNFASLVDICSRTEEGGCGQSDAAKLALDIISIIGVILSGIGLILTILTVLLFKKLRARDASKFHVQLSLSLLCMLLVFVVGIDRTEVFEGCVTVSVLIHYFTLVSVMFMGAEAVLMFQKLVIVFVHITTRYIIIVSLVCWLVPVVPVVIPTAIDREFMITNTETNNFCFIGDVRVFFGAFLGPIFAILLFNAVIFILVIGALVNHNRNKLGKTTDVKSERRRYMRFAINLFGIMVLFGITWILAAFTIRGASLTFQLLFAVFNSLQGFFIFIFFCVLSSDVRQQWLQMVTCGRYVKRKPAYSTGGNKAYNAGQLRSGENQSGLSTGSSAVTSSQYASDSMELSEIPSSRVMAEENTVHAIRPRAHQPPTGSHANVTYQNPATGMEEGGPACPRLGYESMKLTMKF